MSIFKAYDIRGLVPQELNEDITRKIGQAFATFFQAKRVIVGRDMRTHSPAIQKALIDGLLKTGCDVMDIGLSSTPTLYFAAAKIPCDGGINVTASHNAGHYNGFKLCTAGGRPVSADTGIRDLEKLVIDEGPFQEASPGSVESRDLVQAYAEHVASFASGLRPLRIGIDAANGMAGHSVPAILRFFPQLDVKKLFFELDGTFPNHEANPLRKENLQDLQKLVRKENLDLGIAFDGDADRCMFVDEEGDIVPSDCITALLAKEFLKKNQGSAVIYDLRSSWMVAEEILKAGGRSVRERVGHSYIKETMRKEKAVFGGELSGHYYFERNAYCDSGEIAMVAVLNLLSAANAPFSSLIRDLQRYYSTGEVNFEIADKNAAIQKVRLSFAQAQQDELDGITISSGKIGDMDWWWFNLRPSNTEPLLRLNLEASNRVLMEEKKKELFALLGTPARK